MSLQDLVTAKICKTHDKTGWEEYKSICFEIYIASGRYYTSSEYRYGLHQMLVHMLQKFGYYFLAHHEDEKTILYIEGDGPRDIMSGNWLGLPLHVKRCEIGSL
jgi:hypothetical protein